MSPPAPPSIAGHELLGELGRGGMGTVYRARHVATGAERALKVLSGAYGANEIERFRREAEALVRVGGPGVVTVHDAGSERGRPYIVMALLRGGSLRDRLRRTPRWPWRDAVALVRELAVALERCHAAGIVHRDVKPENILFDEEGRALLTDFGCVRDLSARSLTETGAIVGTPAYMAPEQLDGGKVDARADVYSLGAVLHELVSGEAPYAGANLVEVLVKKTKRPPPPLGSPGAPLALGAAVARALAPTPGERFESASALAVALAAVSGGGVAPASASAKTAKSRRPRLALVVLASLLAAAALAGHGRPPASTDADGGAPVSSVAVVPASPTRDPPRARGSSGVNEAVVANALRLLRGNAALAEAKDVFAKAALVADREGASALRAAALDRIAREADAADRTTDWKRLSTAFENGERAFLLARELGLAGPPPAFVEIVEKLTAFVKANVGYEESTRRGIELVVHLKPEVFVPALVALLTTIGGRAVDNDAIVGTLDAAIAVADGKVAEPDPSNLRHLRTVHAFYAWKERKTPEHAKRLAAAVDDFLAKGEQPTIGWALAWGHLARAILLEWEKKPAPALVEWEIADRRSGEALRQTASERVAFDRLHARLLLELDRDLDEALRLLEEVRPLLMPGERESLGSVIGELRAGPTPERRRELITALGGPP